MAESYFTTSDGRWFQPSGHSRGPWDVDACHAGPPTALMVRALERLVADQRLTRVTVELMRPVPMSGFRVQAEVRRPGRSVTLTEAEIFDDDRIYARAFGVHVRVLEPIDLPTPIVAPPNLEAAEPGPFPIEFLKHDLDAFDRSVECRYAPGDSPGGGPTTVWMRSLYPILPDEEPSPFQRIAPLADCGNGISHNADVRVAGFVNTDLTISLHRDPIGEWLASRAISHWQPTGIGLADAELFDTEGPVGRATQTLLLDPTPET